MTHQTGEALAAPKLITRAQLDLVDLQMVEHRGRVVQLIGLVIESQGPRAAIGEICRLESANQSDGVMAEVVGFRNQNLLLMPLGQMEGIYPGCEVIATGTSLKIPVGEELLGRVLNGLGNPLDGLPAPSKFEAAGLNAPHRIRLPDPGSTNCFKRVSVPLILSPQSGWGNEWESFRAAEWGNPPCLG